MIGNRIFLDSNIPVYLAGDDDLKKSKAATFARSGFMISTQVVSENLNVCIKKLKFSKEEAYSFGHDLMNMFSVVDINTAIIENAFKISLKYRFGYWDSLIIATALENKCDILYSEDMQHNNS